MKTFAFARSRPTSRVACWRSLVAGFVAGPIVMAVACATHGCTVAPQHRPDPNPGRLRIALFNIRELSAEKLAQVDGQGVGTHPQVRAAARIIQRVRPDVLVIQEIDHAYGSGSTPPDPDPRGLDLHARAFLNAYLEHGAQPLSYPFMFVAPNNTGILSGRDLDGDGVIASDADRGSRRHGGDSYGFGTYPGQYSMAVFSRYPFVRSEIRTFQKLRWRDFPGHHIPSGHYSPAALEVLRLSSKSHWDLPIEVGRQHLHLWVSHPTPPLFDGAEDRNGRRNFDEIKFWLQYRDGIAALTDDAGHRGGYSCPAPFVIVGDLNARATDRDARYDGVSAIQQLLRDPQIQDPAGLTVSRGAIGARTAGPPDHPERATAVFAGGARVDYVLPCRALRVLDGGVFWPGPGAPAEARRWSEQASDHRLVWVDLSWP